MNSSVSRKSGVRMALAAGAGLLALLSGGGALQRAQAQSGRGGSGDPRVSPTEGHWQVKMEHHWMKHGDHMDSSSSPPIVAADTSSDTDSPPPFPLPSSLGTGYYDIGLPGSRVYGNALTAYTNAEGSSSYRFTWHPRLQADGTPDLTDKAPDKLCFRAQVGASAETNSNEGTWLTAYASTGLDEKNVKVEEGPEGSPDWHYRRESGRVLVQLDNPAHSSTLEWTPPPWNAGAAAKSHPDTSIYSSRWATANADYSLDIAKDDRSARLDVYPKGLSFKIVDQPDNKELSAFARINWKYDGDKLDEPLMPFYGAEAECYFIATRNGQPLTLDPDPYTWTASPDVVLPCPTPEAQIERDRMKPGTNDDTHKTFHWDFGPDPAHLPQDTLVTASATDPSDGMVLSGKALIHWHWAFENGASGDDPSITRPQGATITLAATRNDAGQLQPPVTKPIEQVQPGDKVMLDGHPLRRIVTGKVTNPDGSITLQLGIDPDDNPEDPAYDLNKQIDCINDAYADAQHTGAKYVKLGLEAYLELAKTPYYNLGGAALGALAGKAVELARIAGEASGAAARARQTATRLRAFITRARALLQGGGETAEDAARLEQTIAEVDKEAAQLEHGAEDLEGVAEHANDLAEDAKIEIGCGQAQPEEGTVVTNCFIAGTMIHTINGRLKPIEQIQAGDLVLSRDPKTGQVAAKKVLRTFHHQVSDTLILSLPNGEHIQCTPEHPFYVAGRGFTPAAEIGVGTAIVTRAGPALAPRSINLEVVRATVYNFEVADFHTYFVGRIGLWVHNACGYAPGTAGSAFQNMNGGGGHAIRHLEGTLISDIGSLQSRVAEAEALLTPILENPAFTFNWSLKGTPCKGFVGIVNGENVVVFISKEGKYAGQMLSTRVIDDAQAAAWREIGN